MKREIDFKLLEQELEKLSLNNPSGFASVQELAALLRTSRITIWRWRRSDPNFPKPIRLGTKGFRYSIDAVRQWLHARELRELNDERPSRETP